MNSEVNLWIVQLVPQNKGSEIEKLSIAKSVLRSLIADITQAHCRLSMGWNCDLQLLMGRVSKYIVSAGEQGDDNIVHRWNGMVERMETNWRDMIGGHFLLSEQLDEDDQLEQQLLDGDDVDDDEVEVNFEELEGED